MTMTTKLGKIRSATYGAGGYQDAMFGATFTIEVDGGTVFDFWGAWSTRSESASYSHEEWRGYHASATVRIMNLMRDAGVGDFYELAGKPVEVTFLGHKMQSWRLLDEVL